MDGGLLNCVKNCADADSIYELACARVLKIYADCRHSYVLKRHYLCMVWAFVCAQENVSLGSDQCDIAFVYLFLC